MTLRAAVTPRGMRRSRRMRRRWPPLRQHPRLSRIAAGLLALAVVGAGLAVTSRAPEAAAGSAFTRTIVIARDHLNEDGAQSSVDPRTFSVSVDNITGLRNQQPIRVSWSGAHPTGGIVTDINGVTAQDQEYPVVLMECRGIDSPQAPVGQRVDPTTCWTQTPNGRYQQNPTSFPAWRVDRYAPVAERAARVNAPATPCPGSAGMQAERYTPFVALTPTDDNPLATTTFLEGPSGCGGMSPDGSNDIVAGSLPPNTTYGITRPDGTGDASFVVWTDQQNGSLGCSTTVPCTLEIIPIEGISCDASGAALPPGDQADRPNPGPETEAVKAACETAGVYSAGATAVGSKPGDPAVSGALWWSASNWRNRIAVPLSFATPGNFCDILDTRVPVDIYGSELMTEAADQWAVEFCQDPRRFKFRHVRTGDPLAKTALASGSISAAFESQPPSAGYGGPAVNAPVAVTGFAISYAIDDANGNPYRNLRLNPRLLAKLLTESYWSMPDLRKDFAALPASNPYHAMATNPQNVTADPEFRALNPDVGDLSVINDSMAMLQTLSGDADALYALSQYIATDPEAAAFIAGRPDPWGMVVNPSYKNLGLPLSYWPLLDTYLSPDITMSGCFQTQDGAIVNQVPILSLVSAPKASLSDIALDMEYALPSSTTNCVATTDPGGNIVGRSLKPQPKPQVGHRFVIGITSVGDAKQYNLDTAALQSYATKPSPTAKFTSAQGRFFVTPNDTSMRFAMQLATADDTTHTWPIPYAKLRTQQGQFAYPGTMVVYAAVPTQGLDSTTARRLAQLLRFAAFEGQVPGLDNGQLPPGYLPMTAANGLEPLAAYTQRAADAVEAQQGDVPLVNQPAALLTPPASAAPPQAAAEPSASPTPEFSPWTPGLAAMAFTHSAQSRLAGWALPLVVLTFFVGLVTAGVARARISATMVSSIEARLARLAAMRRNSNSNGNGGNDRSGNGHDGDGGGRSGGTGEAGAGNDAAGGTGESGNPDAARSGM